MAPTPTAASTRTATSFVFIPLLWGCDGQVAHRGDRRATDAPPDG
jgi:hypothetical protein